MASVFTAHDELLDRAVAVKTLRPGEPVDRRRFEREAQMLARLIHPNLVTVYDAGELDGEVFMVLELIEGPTLARRLQRG
ncbi:MAG: protein kinase, partial [Acidimicrobiales bacterium]